MKRLVFLLAMFITTLGYGQTISWGAGISYGNGDPSYTPGNKEARFYYDLGDGDFWKWDGTQWVLIGTGGGPFYLEDGSGNNVLINPLDTLKIHNGVESDPVNGFDIGLGGTLIKNTTIQAESNSFTFNQDNQAYLQTNQFAWTLFPFFPRDSFSWRMWSLDQESNRGVVGTSEAMAATASINGPTGQKNGIVAQPDGVFLYGDDGLYILAPGNDTTSFIKLDTAMLDEVDSTTWLIGLLMPDSVMVKIPWSSLKSAFADGNGIFTEQLRDTVRTDTIFFAPINTRTIWRKNNVANNYLQELQWAGTSHYFTFSDPTTGNLYSRYSLGSQGTQLFGGTSTNFFNDGSFGKLWINNSGDVSLSYNGLGQVNSLLFDFSGLQIDSRGHNFDIDATGIQINDAYYLPLVDGTTNQIIATNGAGTLSWVDPPGGGTPSTLALTGTTLTDGDDNVKLDTVLQNVARANSNFSGGFSKKGSFRDFFKQSYFQDTTSNFDWSAAGVKIQATTVDPTNDRFKVNWSQLYKKLTDLPYNPGYFDDTEMLNWHAYNIVGEDVLRVDSVDIQNEWIYYTMVFGAEPTTSTQWDFYCPFLNIEALDDTLAYNNFPFDLGDTWNTNNVQYYEPGGMIVRSDGSWVQFIFIRSTSPSTSRDLYAFISHDYGRTWKEYKEDYLIDASTVGDLSYTEIFNGFATPMIDTPYIGKILYTFSAINGSEHQPFYCIFNEDLSFHVPPTEIPITQPSYANHFRLSNVIRHNGKVYVPGITTDGATSANDPSIMWQFNSITDYLNGNVAKHDTVVIFQDYSTLLAEKSDGLYGHLWNDTIWLVSIPSSTVGSNALNGNRVYMAYSWDDGADTARLNEMYPIISAMSQSGYYDTETGDAWSDHMGGYVHFNELNDNLYLTFSVKGENTSTEYYRVHTMKVRPKSNGRSGLEIADGSIEARDLNVDVIGNIFRETLGDVTDYTVFLKRRQKGIYRINVGALTGTCSVSLDKPAFFGAPEYIFHITGVSGTKNVAWPSNVLDETGTALGTVGYTSDTIVNCYYDYDGKSFYCK